MTTTTKDYYSRADGEYFADEGSKPIPAQDTWDNLSVNQLLDVQSQLYDKIWAFSSNQAIRSRLEVALQKLQALISLRNSGG